MMFTVRSKETASMHTRDGIRLDADVYRPDAEGEFPVLLMRQPYGRAIASTVAYAHPIWYAAHGYIVVIQDVRGRGSSEGTFKLFANDIEDGEDTVYWASTLPGSTGQVGMYGFSYQGIAQLYASANQPEPLKTICPAMFGYDLYADWAYEGGALSLYASLGWAIQLAAETARRDGNGEAYNTLYAAARSPLVCDPVNGHSDLLAKLAPDSFYHDWLAHPKPGTYWDNLSPGKYIKDVDMPMLHIGGWYDTYLRGTIRFYQEMASRSKYTQHLWIGPWAHIPWGRKVGAIDFGIHAGSPIDTLQVQWFDHILKGKAADHLKQSPVNLFEMGSNQWRSLSSWPNTSNHTLFLESSGLASMSETSGTLVLQSSTPSSGSSVPDVLVHDPWRPVPSQGGHASAPSGPFERTSLDCRSDVLTYTSEPLHEAWHLAGEINVELLCTSDSESFDLCAVLSEVYPDGRIFNISQGYSRIISDPQLQSQPQRCHVQLQATCMYIPIGHAVRLSVSGANFPAHPINSGRINSGKVQNESDDCLIDAQVSTIYLWTHASPACRIQCFLSLSI